MEKIHDIIGEIIAHDNMSTSFDYVIRDLPYGKERLRKQKEKIIAKLSAKISKGSFRVTKYRELHVEDGPKERDVQAPPVIKRIGCHAIMAVFEKYAYQTTIETTAASIKGRGMHWLHHIVEDDVKQCPQNLYYYKCDIVKFYDTIDQDLMYSCLERYTDDEIILKIFDNFVRLMPKGISKGLRSSQCFANILLNDIDHHFKDELQVRYYYRYCDDIVMLSPSKKQLWEWRDILHEKIHELKLEIKNNEAVRPLSDGLDFLGFVQFQTHSLLRKRIKQKAARHLAKIKSRRRRQEIIGSFKGMACHADCKNLFYKLTHQNMKKFSEMGVVYTPEDGKKRFPGKTVRLSAIVNKPIEVHDYEKDIKTANGDDRYLVSFRDTLTGEWGKFFTASAEMKQILDKISDVEEGYPFETVIESEVFDGNKMKYRFT